MRQKQKIVVKQDFDQVEDDLDDFVIEEVSKNLNIYQLFHYQSESMINKSDIKVNFLFFQSYLIINYNIMF